MNDIQINGQRRLGPPEKWSGPPPVHGTEIFIKNLPKEVFELELYALFSAAGIIYEVRLPVNWNGLNRGYAFIRFTSVSAADKAIDVFDNYEIRNSRKIRVARSVDNTRLFLSAVPIEKNAEELKNDLLNYVENVKKVYVYPTLENRSVFRGYAFVEFETHRDAAIAKRILTPDVCHGIFGKKCVAAWANPLPFLDQSVLKSLNVLFIRNIPKDISGFHLKQIIENSTKEEIQRIKKLNDFAFLTFKDHKSAKNALNYLKNSPFVILDHEAQAEWAVPKEMVASYTEKKCEDLRIFCTRSGNSNFSSTFDFNGAISEDVSNIQNYPTFLSNPPIFHDRNNEIFGPGENRNRGLSQDETVFYANPLKNLNACIRRQDTSDSRYNHQGFEGDTHHIHRPNVLSPLATTENEHIFNSSCSNYCQPGNTLFHRTSPELYSPFVRPGGGFDKTKRKSPGHLKFFEKFMENVNFPFSNTIKSFENIGYPLQRIHNSDSDSDESLMNLSRLGASPTSPSAVTNWSLGTASQTLSCDEQDVNPQSPIRQYYY